MGFTRYWIRPREFEPATFAAFATACKNRCASLEVNLLSARFSDEIVYFVGDPGCEPFVIERASKGRERHGRVSEFCKTQNLPYDVAVEDCLVLLKGHFSDVEIPKPS